MLIHKGVQVLLGYTSVNMSIDSFVGFQETDRLQKLALQRVSFYRFVFSAVLEVNKRFFAMNFEGKSTFYRR